MRFPNCWFQIEATPVTASFVWVLPTAFSLLSLDRCVFWLWRPCFLRLLFCIQRCLYPECFWFRSQWLDPRPSFPVAKCLWATSMGNLWELPKKCAITCMGEALQDLTNFQLHLKTISWWQNPREQWREPLIWFFALGRCSLREDLSLSISGIIRHLNII